MIYIANSESELVMYLVGGLNLKSSNFVSLAVVNVFINSISISQL